MTSRVKVPGRGWAYTGAILGGLVSIAANVAHSFIPPAGSAASWRPEPGAVVGAVVWPVFLFVAVEIFARVRWPQGLAWSLVRWVGLLPVAGLAALVSYRHLSGLLAHYGEEPIIYYVGPIAVDGLMVMATGALLATGRHRNPTAPVTPVSESVSIPAAAPTTRGLAVAPSVSPPPVVAAAKPDQPTTAPAVTPAVVAQRISTPARRPAASAPAPRPGTPTTTRTKTSKKTTPPASKPAPSATDTPVTAPDRARPTGSVVPPDLLARVRAEAAKHRTEHGTPISPGQLAVRLRMTSEQAQQALALLNLAHDRATAPAQAVNGTSTVTA